MAVMVRSTPGLGHSGGELLIKGGLWADWVSGEAGAGGDGDGAWGSAGGCGFGATVKPGQGEEEEVVEDVEVEEVVDVMLVIWNSLCNWLLTMLFMALCISASIRCFSRFGMRPKRTASRDMPTDRHFLKRHCWQRFRLILMMVQVSFFRHFLYWMFC